MQAKTGHETPGDVKRLWNDQRTKDIRKARKELRLESINTNQVARISKATARSELSTMRWHPEEPAGQKKARETPHTLHERRPQEKNKSQASHKAEQLVKNAMVSEDIKDDWLKLIQEEDILARDAKAFIPRVQEEETNPTFEHPEEWSGLTLQEKAHLMLIDQVVKLMGQLCQGGDNGPPESVNCAGQISITPHVASEMAGTVGGGCEGRTYISHTPRDMAVSSPQAVGETGGLSSSPLNNSGVRGHTEYKKATPWRLHLKEHSQVRMLSI